MNERITALEGSLDRFRRGQTEKAKKNNNKKMKRLGYKERVCVGGSVGGGGGGEGQG